MSTYKHYILVLLIAFAVLIGFVVSAQQESAVAPEQVATTTEPSATTTVRALHPGDLVPTPPAQVANATLKIGSTTYPITIHRGETLLEAMRATNVALTGRDYAGLGFFVESIQGVPNAGGKYWVFYVNGVSSTGGVSSTVLKEGDVVEWQFRNKY